MDQPAPRAELVGVAVLAAAMLLVELLSYRLAAAALGDGFAVLTSLWAPAACALGAFGAGRLSRHRLAHRGAHHRVYLAVAAGATLVVATVVTSWASERVAAANGQADAMALALPMVVWMAPAACGGAALGLGAQRFALAVGRFGLAIGLGSLVACVAWPLGLVVGAPRAALATALLYALAAVLFAWAARPLRVRWGVVLTLPLAVSALLAGDLGAPWLRVRTDQGRRSRVARAVWTAGGALAVWRPSRGKTRFTIDRTPAGLLATKKKTKRKPRFEIEDLIYLISGRKTGPVLLIGATGGRGLQAALAYGHPRIDALVPSRVLVDEVVLGGAEGAGWLGRDPRLRLTVGATAGAIAALPRDYQHVVVLSAARLSPVAPRLLALEDRALTVQAIGRYLDRLRAGGSLMLQVALPSLRSVLGTVVVAAGADRRRTSQRLFVCSSESRAVAVVILGRDPLGVARTQRLSKRCKKARYQVVFSPQGGQLRRRHPPHAADAAARLAALAAPAETSVPTDDRPFLQPAPRLATLLSTAAATLGALGPRRSAPKPKSAKKAPPEQPPHRAPAAEHGSATAGVAAKKRARSGARITAPPAATVALPSGGPERSAGLAVGALGGALVVILLLWLVGPRRTATLPAAWPLGVALPLLGAALALAVFSVIDRLLLQLGAGYGWGLLVPMSFAGVAIGWLWSDTISARWIRRVTLGAMLVAVAWVLVVPRLVASFAAAPVGAGLLVLITAGLLSAPVALALSAVGRTDGGALAWLWGAQQAGWALGSALAVLLASLIGLGSLPVAAAIALAVGGAVLLLGLSPRWRAEGSVTGRISGAGAAEPAGPPAPAAGR